MFFPMTEGGGTSSGSPNVQVEGLDSSQDDRIAQLKVPTCSLCPWVLPRPPAHITKKQDTHCCRGWVGR